LSVASINDPKHWLGRAKEARALAEQIDDPEAKRTMLATADDYERLAKRAQERAAGRWPQITTADSQNAESERPLHGGPLLSIKCLLDGGRPDPSVKAESSMKHPTPSDFIVIVNVNETHVSVTQMAHSLAVKGDTPL